MIRETCSGPGEGQEAKTNRSELSFVTPSARSNVDSVLRRARSLGHTARASLRSAHGLSWRVPELKFLPLPQVSAFRRLTASLSLLSFAES